MKKKIAFITGIAGQDGSYLTEHLLKKDYKIYGIVRRNSVVEHQINRIEHLSKNVELSYGDLRRGHHSSKSYQKLSQMKYIILQPSLM